VNPDEASYCYYDGRELGNHKHNGGPVRSGTALFANAFVFPSGTECRNFDQFAVACQEHWKEAVGLLEEGYLETFLGGLGRADLALAAKEAARFPDHDRGLDQLLAKIPSDAVEAPKLQVEPTEINLGQLKVGEDRAIELHLANQGMRLLYGSVTCEDCVWLALGDAPGARQKLFQFGSELVIPVHVRGDRLRAGNKPVVGELSVESNGGSTSVVIRAEVPVKPFAEGVLAGATSPRKVAEKAKASPKEAAPLFENGAVAKWYQENGWTYPVQGPAASGLGAVQQFFEALGLTPPPKVAISEKSVALRGNPGEQLRHTLEVKTQEKRPVYAHGVSDQSWLEVGRPRLNGRIATIPLAIPNVPAREGEILQAKVTVTANGNQRFVVPVSLEIGYTFNFTTAPAPAPAPVEAVTAAVPAAASVTAAAPAQAKPLERSDLGLVPGRPAGPAKPAWTARDLVHAVPVALLGLVLLGIIGYDALFGGKPPDTRIVATEPGLEDDDSGGDPDPRITVQFSHETSRFGLVMSREKDDKAPGGLKRLTSDEQGRNNNTCIKIGESPRLFGQEPGRWYRDRDDNGVGRLAETKQKHLWESDWYYPDHNILVRQYVRIVRGEQTGLLDTCLVRYVIENKNTRPVGVGLRVLLDTFIGSNDGVPFLIPGQKDLLDTKQSFGEKDIPDSISALEFPDPKNPGTVVQMGLRLHGVEPIHKMIIGKWPGSDTRWDWDPVEAMNVDPPKGQKGDSCVAVYWAYRPMEPGEKRVMAFTYGLGTVSSTGSKLGLLAHGSTQPGGVFTVTALVKNPTAGQKVKIDLPEGLSLEGDDPAEQTVEAAGKDKDAQVSWRVRVGNRTGDYTIGVSSGVIKEQFTVKVNKKSIFN
jgi:hypothetical protein